MKPLRAIYERLVVPPPPWRFDHRLEERVSALIRGGEAGPRVLNLGSGTGMSQANVVNVDLFPFPGVHVRGDGTRLPFQGEVFQGVLLRGVLEHASSAEAIVEEASRVLRPGGFLYVEVPFLQPYHESPEDYRRFTLPGLRRFLRNFEETDSGVQVGPGSSLAWVAREALASVLAFGSEFRYRKALTALGWLTFWLRELDRFVVNAPFVARSASAVYFLGRKREGGAISGA